MSQQPCIPDAQTRQKLLANLRKTRLDLQETTLELEEINAILEQQIREQRLKRSRISLQNLKKC